MKEPSRAPVAVRRCRLLTRAHVPLVFEPLEGRVPRAGGARASRSRFDLAANAHAVGTAFEPRDRKHDDLFELAEICAARHERYFYKTEDDLSNARVARALTPFADRCPRGQRA